MPMPIDVIVQPGGKRLAHAPIVVAQLVIAVDRPAIDAKVPGLEIGLELGPVLTGAEVGRQFARAPNMPRMISSR